MIANNSLALSVLQRLASHQEFCDAYSVVQKIAVGDSWLFGGCLYKTIASILHDTPMPQGDVDFLVHKLVDLPALHDLVYPWSLSQSRFGNLKLIKGNFMMDVIPFEKMYFVMTNSLEPTLESVLEGSPLTIQHISLNLTSNHLYGKALSSIARKEMQVYNISEAMHAASMKGVALEQYMADRNKGLGFRIIPPCTVETLPKTL